MQISPRLLIVNADDFGTSRGVNQGVIQGFASGIVTSASLMTRGGAAREAGALAREHPRLSLGLHIDLGEWVFRDGQWETLYPVVPLDDIVRVKREVRRQLESFRSLCGRDPTHLDSHQHVHRRRNILPVVEEIAGELDVPLRHFTPGITYCGLFYGQTDNGSPLPELIEPAALARIVAGLPAGVTELCCHPAAEVDFQSMYDRERLLELQALCDPALLGAIEASGVKLTSFHDLRSGDP